MPPRAAGRRQPRFSSREPDTPSNQTLSAFQKPHLPPLQGTPSSRRQYSYGAEVEPMPSRPGQGLQSGSRTQVRDISNAVRSALTRQEGEENGEEEARRQLRAPGQARHQPSYLSGPSEQGGFAGPQFLSKDQGLEGSDADDVRSFGMESDFYGDATIDSTPRAPPTKRTQPSPLSEVRTVDAHSAAEAVQMSTHPNNADSSTEDQVDFVTQPAQNSRLSPARLTVGPSPLRAAPRRPPKPTLQSAAPRLTRSSRPQAIPEADDEVEDAEVTEDEREPEDEGQDNDEEEETEEDESTGHRDSQHIFKTNTPAPRRRQPPSGQVSQKTRLSGPSPALPPPQRSQPAGRRGDSFTASGQVRHGRDASLRQTRQSVDRSITGSQASEGAEMSPESSTGSGRWLARATATSNFSSLFAHAKLLATSSPFTMNRRYPLDQSERDAAIQRDIDAAEAELAQERRQQAAAEFRQRWAQRWLWLRSLMPFSQQVQGTTDADSPSIEDSSGQRAPFNFLYFLNPLTYLQWIVSLAEAILNWIMQLIHYIIPTRLWDRLSSIFGFLPHIIAGVLAFVLAFAIATQLASSTDEDWMSNTLEITRRTLYDMRNKISDSIPTVSWPKRDRWADLNDLWDDDDTASDRIEQFLNRMEDEFLALKRAGKMHEASLEKLEKVVPSVVHMELRDGKPVVSQEFWHALRDLLRGDGAFMTFNKIGSEYEISSDHQWKAIASRLVTDPVFSSTLDFALEDFGNKMNGRITTFWDTWVKDNDEKIAQMLGSAVDQIKSAGSQKEFEDRLTKIVKEQLAQTENQRGQVVTRDEFLRHLRNEFASHRSEIRAELKDLQPQMEQLIKQSVELATKDIPHGMSRADVTTLVNGLIRKAMADVNLEAMARGTIHRHWDSDLRHQINYFSVGSGAIIDAKHSSSTWDPTRSGIITQGQYQHGLRGSKGFPPIAALDSWQEQGDCWCAARSVNHRGNPHGASLAVQLAHRIVPQHIVVEHILPGATSEPGARPKDIEVYAEILDSDVRERILDFGAAYFPDDKNDWNLTPPDYHHRFVKISQFVYEAADIHDGVYVHRLSSELVGLGAATDHVIVRAVSNYGAENHTCFYRVRLYGFNPEVDAWP